MSDVTINKDQVLKWFQSPRVVTTIHALLASSGVIGVQLVKWGFPAADLGPLTDLVIEALPFAAVWAWNMATRGYDAIISKAALIIASRGGSDAAKAKMVVAIGGDATPGVTVNVDRTAPIEIQAAAEVSPGLRLVQDAASIVVPRGAT